MGNKQTILVTTKSLRLGVASVMGITALLIGCGQKGALYLPNDPEFQQRATLPDIVRRQIPLGAATPASGAAATSPSATAPTSSASSTSGR